MMKASVRLLLVAAYSFCVGVAVSHSWAWSAFEETSPSVFANGYIAGIAQIATITTPIILFVVFVTNWWLDGISNIIREAGGRR